MSGEERLQVGLQLHELACEIARDSIRALLPNASVAEVEEELHSRLRLAYESNTQQASQ
jgi:ribosomal protein L19E